MDTTTTAAAPVSVTSRAGGCHCGAVRFEARVNLEPGGPSKCNCSICTKLGSTGAVMAPHDFQLVAGEGSLSEYVWGGRVQTRYFCKHCGVHCFARGHLAELGGDFVAINVNTLDDVDVAELELVYWDGRHDNWHAGPRASAWPLRAAAHG